MGCGISTLQVQTQIYFITNINLNIILISDHILTAEHKLAKCGIIKSCSPNKIFRKLVKFVYSEKDTKFCEISTLLLFVCTVDKRKVEISQNFVAFSEYMNFNHQDGKWKKIIHFGKKSSNNMQFHQRCTQACIYLLRICTIPFGNLEMRLLF